MAVGSIQSTGTATDPTATAAAAPTKDIANKDTFLQLLIAQLKNQDPLQPQDGAAFVTQLAQFSNLEQVIASREDLDAIRQALAVRAASDPSTSASTQKSQG